MKYQSKPSTPPPFETVMAMAGLFLLSGLLLIFMCVRALPQKYELERAGQSAQAQITHCASGRSSRSCSYTFLVQGNEYEGQDGSARARVGDSVQVLYLARDPFINEFADNSSPDGAIGFGIFGGLMAVVSFATMLVALHKKNRDELMPTGRG